MDAGLLVKIFGSDSAWNGPCTVILDAEASVRPTGPDSILAGGIKNYSPRVISGRVAADNVCLLADHSALLLVQRHRHRQSTGEELLKQTLLVVDVAHVVGLEFTDTSLLAALDVPEAPIPTNESFAPDALVG